MYAGHVAAGLYEPCYLFVLAHGHHAIVEGLHGLHHTCRDIGGEHIFCVGTLHFKHHALFGHVILFLYGCSEDVPLGTHLFLLVGWYAEEYPTVAWDGVVHLARMPLCQAQAPLLLYGIKEP